MTCYGTDELIAVVGMGVAVPGASSPAELWRVLNGPRDVFAEPGDRYRLDRFWSPDRGETDRTYARRAGYLHDFRPHHRLAAQDADGKRGDQAARWLRHSLLQARTGVGIRAGDRCGAYVGAWPGGSQSLVGSVLVELLSRPGPGEALDEEVRAALLAHYPHAVPLERAATPDAVVRQVFTGLTEQVTESLVVDTACASSLYAVDLGCKSLLAGECEIAYCGGVNVIDPTMAVMFAKLSGLSPQGRVRAFTGDSDGTLFSDGAGMVTLKTVRRAREDGDEVLGVLLGFGGAADGRGKSISAPNPAGQRRAVQRARSVCGITGEQVDWVVAHGTGTPAGDGVESQVVAELGPASGQWTSSNKPVFGHTGWTAGVLSLMHALSGLRKGWIPGQLGAAEPVTRVSGANIRVPGRPVRFAPRPDRRRVVGVSAFGFGGTNAHLLVADRADDDRLRSGRAVRPDSGELALVAWSAHLPGAPPRTAVQEWLGGSGTAPAARFPHPYPSPPAAEARLSARTLPSVDAGQLMALQAAARFVREHGEPWADIRESTGVIAAHTGIPSGLVGTAVRCYADDAAAVLGRQPGDRDFRHALRHLEKTRQRYPATTEDTQAGVLPNVIASRIAARYDLHGPTMAVDAGLDSTLAALRVARHYLGTGELELALIVAVNGNGSPESAALAGIAATKLGEGAFLLAVTTTRAAAARGLPVLAKLSFGEGGRERPRSPDRSYLAADHAVALLRAVQRETLPTRLPAHHTDNALLVSPPRRGAERQDGEEAVRQEGQESAPRDGEEPVRQDGQESAPRDGEEAVRQDGQESAPRDGEEAVRQDGQESAPRDGRAPERLTRRYRKRLVAEPAPAPGECAPGAPASLPRRGLVLLADPAAGDRVREDLEASDSFVTELPVARDGSLSPADVDRLLAVADTAAPHLTVLGDLTGLSMPRALALHDAVFLLAQRLWPRWEPESSLAVLLGGAPGCRSAHPAAALFDGFVKSLRWEREGSVAFTLTSDEPVTPSLLGRLARERGARPSPPPVLRHLQGRRWIEALHPVPLAETQDLAPGLFEDGEPVGVVTGGAGDIVQELLGALPARRRPALWLLGRTPARPLPPELEDAVGGRGAAERAGLIRRLRAAHPQASVPELVARADALLRQRKTHLAVQALRDRFGEHKVHYLACDIRDREAVLSAVARVREAHERVDFVIHAAGQVSSALLGKKRLETFRAVRDTKVLGRLHLKAALGAHQPALWCNIGSFSGAAGAPGDTDYASGNAYLDAAAEAVTGSREITVNFTMWRQTGMGSDPLFQEHVSRQHRFTPITTAEGTAQFLQEFAAAPRAGGASTYLGRTEREGLRSHLPGLVRTEPPAHPAARLWPAWRTPCPAADNGTWACPMDPESDPHLFDHLVSGKPTVPGTFILDIAAQAAEALLPGTFASGFRDARFDTFIRPFNRREPSPLRIKARLAHRPAGDEDRAAVEVSVHSDILGPDGLMREAALRHFRAEVLVSRTAPAPPPNRRPVAGPAAEPAQDPYVLPGAGVSLRGPFHNLSHCSADASTAHGTWTPHLAGYPGLRTMAIPALLMDAALRTSALRPAGHQRPWYVPQALARAELYTNGANDHDLLLRHGHSLRVSRDADGVLRAATAEGRVLLEMSGPTLVEMAA
ncbi:SDR family NAD(P)-dependent oxidoreductase [Streptomyces sp. NPDC000134]|uniref:SDR family NAD(P)-dependent oxidoreductase n=1 Tax=Streptomyces sp. NPDC000134 TaxID=3364536 RepID=UPI0036AF8C44